MYGPVCSRIECFTPCPPVMARSAHPSCSRLQNIPVPHPMRIMIHVCSCSCTQAAATTARALRASLASDPSSSGLPGNTPVQRALFQGPAGAGVQPPVNPLAAEVDAIHGELQGLLMQVRRGSDVS